jgi:hypothetical protein
MPTIYSRKDGLSWCGPPAEEASMRPGHIAQQAIDDTVPAFVVRRMEDGTLDLVMLRLPEEEVEERLAVDLGSMPQPHETGTAA